MSSASKTSTPKDRLGFVGLGTMGAHMAMNLARAAYPLTVWNRTPGRADELVQLGAREAASPAELARSSDIIFTCVTDSPQVEVVLFGPGGVAEGALPGSLVIDCSTISPTRAIEFASRLNENGVSMLDAPVSGGSEGARLATLTILVGGETDQFERASPVLSSIGGTISHLGPLGAGQWAKAVNQVILAGTYLGVAEGVTLAVKAGLDARRVIDALTGGAAGSWVLENRSGRMIDDEYPIGFKIALHRKDLGIGLELARQVGAVLPIAALAAAFEVGIIAEGHGDEDISALARTIRKLSGL
jgi:3-hydroxyisobutyrate dehydrogenase